MQFVFVVTPGKTQGYEKAESPQYASEQGMTLDVEHYLDHQVCTIPLWAPYILGF